jgi:hypothetical protein
MLVNEHIVSRICQICQNLFKVESKLSLGQKFDPLNKNVHIPPLEQNIVPLGLLDEIEHIAYIQLLLLRCLVVLMDFAQHTDNREESILLELTLQF